MKPHLIIGAAGHVDHGKTALVTRLTGVDTDRLPAEKQRGLSIEIGFAPLRLPSGRTVSIIDVPGHERFIKNMLVGATGVDIVLLVIAADEGVMPQTREHVCALQHLRASHGVVALTKTDLVEEDWLELVEEDVRQYLATTFLASAPVVRVSAITGSGLPALLDALDAVADSAPVARHGAGFRLAVDRCFLSEGFGVIVTGTVAHGGVSDGDEVTVEPAGLQARVRRVQVHGEVVETAHPGQRAALNLSGVDREQVPRGSWVATPGLLAPARHLDAHITLDPTAPRRLRHGDIVRLHHGASEHLPRCRVHTGREIQPGDSGYIQIVAREPIAALRGDRFVLRSYSPMRVIGGGEIVDAAPQPHRRRTRVDVNMLSALHSGTPAEVALVLAARAGGRGVPREQLQRALYRDNAETVIAELTESGRLVDVGEARFVAVSTLEQLGRHALKILDAYHDAHRLRAGMPQEELRSQLGRAIEPTVFRILLQRLVADGQITVNAGAIARATHVTALNAEQQTAVDRLLTVAGERGVNALTLEEATCHLETDEARKLLEHLLETGQLVRVQDFVYAPQVLEQVRTTTVAHLRDNQRLTVSEFRQLHGTTRKFAIPLLEWLDANAVTVREGDVRRLRRA